MKRNACVFLLVVFWGSIFSQSTSPQVLSNGGDSYNILGITIDWTLGEPIIETFLNDGFALTQGFQQGSLIITRINELADLNYKIKVFPNPTAAQLNMRIQHPQIQKTALRYLVIDLQGKILLQGRVDSYFQSLDLHQFSRGMYLLKLFEESNNHLQTFKIVKID